MSKYRKWDPDWIKYTLKNSQNNVEKPVKGKSNHCNMYVSWFYKKWSKFPAKILSVFVGWVNQTLKFYMNITRLNQCEECFDYIAWTAPLCSKILLHWHCKKETCSNLSRRKGNRKDLCKTDFRVDFHIFRSDLPKGYPWCFNYMPLVEKFGLQKQFLSGFHLNSIWIQFGNVNFRRPQRPVVIFP